MTDVCDNVPARQNAASRPTPTSVITFSSIQSERLTGASASATQKIANAANTTRTPIGLPRSDATSTSSVQRRCVVNCRAADACAQTLG